MLSGEQMYLRVKASEENKKSNKLFEKQFQYYQQPNTDNDNDNEYRQNIHPDLSTLANSASGEIVLNDTTKTTTNRSNKYKMNANQIGVTKHQQPPMPHSHSNYYRFVEMEEIFFNCSINSNPEAHSTEWFCNEKLIFTDIPKGKKSE